MAISCALAPLAHAQAFAVEGRLLLNERSDFAAIDGVRIHDWSRNYRQGSDITNDFGPGWESPLHARIVRLPGGSVVVAGSSAGWIEYPGGDEQTRDRNAVLLSDEAEKHHRNVDKRELRRNLYALTRLTLGLNKEAAWAPGRERWLDPLCQGAGVAQREQGYVHTPCKGPVEYFDKQGRLTEIRYAGATSAKSGETKRLQIHRDPSGALSGVSDGAGNRIDFERNGDRIHAARTRHEGAEFVVRYAYDDRGRLVSTTETAAAGKERAGRSYAYDDADRLTKVGAGGTAETVAYEPSGRVAAIEPQRTYTYQESEDGSLKTHMTWTDGRKKLVQDSETDRYGRTVAAYDATGSRILYEPRTGLRLTSVDGQGVERRYTYSGTRLRTIHASNGDMLHLTHGADGLPSELKLTAGTQGKDGTPTEFATLLAPASSAVIKLAWKARDKPTRIAWIGHCTIRMSYGPDGEPVAEPAIDGRQECIKQLGNIYGSLF